MTGSVQLYYFLRSISLTLMAVCILIMAIYGYRINIYMIFLKKTGLQKRREINQMKEGKRIKRRVISKAEQERDLQIYMEENSQTEKLSKEETAEDYVTQVLSPAEAGKPVSFAVIKSVLVVHGDAL